jgi:hypothetical protein
MPIVPPHEHAARLIAHYLKHLTIATGKRWTSQNDADMTLLAGLLEQDDAGDTIPPFHCNNVTDTPPALTTAVTQVFEREGNDAIPDEGFQRWRGRQTSDAEDVRRLVRR